MQVKEKPEIVASKEKSFTCISFKPDLAKFGMTKLDDDIVSLLTKRVYDIAGSTNASRRKKRLRKRLRKRPRRSARCISMERSWT